MLGLDSLSFEFNGAVGVEALDNWRPGDPSGRDVAFKGGTVVPPPETQSIFPRSNRDSCYQGVRITARNYYQTPKHRCIGG